MLLCIVQCLVLVFPAATVLANDRDYLIGSLPAQEGADIGAVSTLVKISEDPAWAGITSQATIKAAESIAPIGEQKATVIDSAIAEGFASAGATYPLFAVDCAWQKLDTQTQDLMYYIELPANSSALRVWSMTCNSWGFWVTTDGMEYQYLAEGSDAWVNGKVSTDGNKTLTLTPASRAMSATR